jgi:hypothetical protein
MLSRQPRISLIRGGNTADQDGRVAAEGCAINVEPLLVLVIPGGD